MRPSKKHYRKFFRPKYAKIRTNADYLRFPSCYLYGAERKPFFPAAVPNGEPVAGG